MFSDPIPTGIPIPGLSSSVVSMVSLALVSAATLVLQASSWEKQNLVAAQAAAKVGAWSDGKKHTKSEKSFRNLGDNFQLHVCVCDHSEPL